MDTFTIDEQEFWLELRRKEHEQRAMNLCDTRDRFSILHQRVLSDEPKDSEATKAVNGADSALGRCRFSLEDIAAGEFNDPFALTTFDPNGPTDAVPPSEAEADAWMNPEAWWTPAATSRITGCSRESLLGAARCGKFSIRAAKSGLLYHAKGAVTFVDGH